jgi:hypothetical protein
MRLFRRNGRPTVDGRSRGHRKAHGRNGLVLPCDEWVVVVVISDGDLETGVADVRSHLEMDATVDVLRAFARSMLGSVDV